MHKPRVSIGMPVYNARNYLRDAIESIRAQTYRDLEIVISDNASTDGTDELCADFAARDSRIRYFRNPRNLGAGFNHVRVAELACGEYFKWHSRDDLCDPRLIERCVDMLDSNPDVQLCHSRTQLINENGEVTADYLRHLRTDGDRADLRFRELVWHDHKCFPIYGVMRLATLRRVGGMPCCVGGDDILLVRLALAGKIVELPEVLFFSRQHAEQSGRTLPGHFEGQRRLFPNAVGNLPPLDWWDPGMKGRVAFPEATLLRHYVAAVRTAPQSLAAKTLCAVWLVPWFAKHVPRFLDDCKIAADLILAPLLNGGRRARLTREGGEAG